MGPCCRVYLHMLLFTYCNCLRFEFSVASKGVSFEFSLLFASFLKNSFSIILDSKMASGRAPTCEKRLQIRPLLPDEEVPRGRARDWLSVHNCRYPKRV